MQSRKHTLTNHSSRVKRKRRARVVAKPPTVDDIEEFHGHLMEWYDASCRDLPWRKSPCSGEELSDVEQFAYRVWVSEVMLQQTQVSKVIDYFQRWMTKWPTVQELAEADLEEVRETWAGLGYYSRASNLHKGAKFITETFKGRFPRSVNELRKIPGVGPYTSRAIASIAMGAREAVVDGNVIRVLARIHAIEGDPKQLASFFQITADKMLNKDRPGDHNQALMELGALICRPMNPQCEQCPVKQHCSALRNTAIGRPVTYYPMTSKKPEKQIRKVDVCLLQLLPDPPTSSDLPLVGWYLMLKRPPTGLLAGLWEFPTVLSTSFEDRVNTMNDFLVEKCGVESIGWLEDHLVSRSFLGDVVHVFSHVHMTLQIEHLVLHGHPDNFSFPSSVQHKWVKNCEMDSIGMCSMVKKKAQPLILLNLYTEQDTTENTEYIA